MPRLRFLNGPKRDRTVELQGGEVLGREAGIAVQLTGEGIAAQHCRVVRVDPYFFLIDLSSETGTFVNEER
ncbi:MAG TPA: GGDEF domain-containing protein, partial [Planctomycetes bacterium]|nr:GGDEF domain-containing protein [Planctomycetota bacterium]